MFKRAQNGICRGCCYIFSGSVIYGLIVAAGVVVPSTSPGTGISSPSPGKVPQELPRILSQQGNQFGRVCAPECYEIDASRCKTVIFCTLI